MPVRLPAHQIVETRRRSSVPRPARRALIPACAPTSTTEQHGDSSSGPWARDQAAPAARWPSKASRMSTRRPTKQNSAASTSADEPAEDQHGDERRLGLPDEVPEERQRARRQRVVRRLPKDVDPCVEEIEQALHHGRRLLLSCALMLHRYCDISHDISNSMPLGRILRHGRPRRCPIRLLPPPSLSSSPGTRRTGAPRAGHRARRWRSARRACPPPRSRPLSITTSRSMAAMVDSRWAMAITVLPSISR